MIDQQKLKFWTLNVTSNEVLWKPKGHNSIKLWPFWVLQAFPHFGKTWCKSRDSIFCNLAWVGKKVILRVMLHLFFSIWGIRKVQEIFNSSPLNQQPEKKNDLKCWTSHLVSNMQKAKCKKPSDGSVVLVFRYGFKSIVNRHLSTAGSF